MNKIFTIPNIISFFRLLLIPIFVVLYFKNNIPNHYVWAVVVVLVSGASDVLDGIIARNFNMVSDLGKVLDPIADKLTHAVVLLCLAIQHTVIFPMFAVLFIKELLTLFAAVHLLSSGTKPISARWWGKLSTVVIFLTMFYTVMMDIFSLPSLPLVILVVLSIICMLLSVGGYFHMFSNQIKGEKNK